MTEHPFASLPDLASRALGAAVVHANDELFAERENLIKPGPAEFAADSFGHKGKIYDGWETRRRRDDGHDFAIVRLGVPGLVRGIIIDTAWFKGNYPPFASVEATSVEGYPSPEELLAARWDTLLPRSAIKGDAENAFEVAAAFSYTHVRLSIYPDGGVARFRMHGEPIADPRLLGGTIDLAALENGGTVADCSNMFYSSPIQLIMPGRARSMQDGWENARRRGAGNDFVEFRLAGRGNVRIAELDTSYFIGNAPGWASLSARDAGTADPSAWRVLLPRTRLQPDTRHRFGLDDGVEVTDVRLDVYPDGGLARVRLLGPLASGARHDLMLRWFNALPPFHAMEILEAGGVGVAERTISARPLADIEQLPAVLRG